MSYATIEAAAVLVIQKHADFDTTNCLAGDNKPIGSGLARVCRVLYGGYRKAPITLQVEKFTWTINLDVYVAYRGSKTTLEAALATERQKVIDKLGLYPLLDSATGVVRAEITNGDKPEPLGQKNAAYRGQRLYLEVDEYVTPAREE